MPLPTIIARPAVIVIVATFPPEVVVALRQTLDRRPALTNGLTVLILLAAAGFLAFDWLRPRPHLPGERLYFSADDGRTTFADDAGRLPPFDHDGRPAVRAYVYSCGGSTPFVAYLERYTPQLLAALETARTTRVAPIDQEFQFAQGTEVKRPGDAAWVKRSSGDGQKILDVHCPDGQAGPPESVLPED